MSALEEAVWRKMIEYEDETFSFTDFVPDFFVNGKKYQIAYGTFRNIASKLVKARKIRVIYYSPQAFYCVVNQSSVMTNSHTGVKSFQNMYKTSRQISNDPIFRIIHNAILGKRSLHDIHFRFMVRGIWITLSKRYEQNSYSKDILLDSTSWKINSLEVRVSIHATDTVGVTIGCSYCPIVVDIYGAIRLSNTLSILKERLSILIANCACAEKESVDPEPDPMTWTVTMWHFAADTLVEYTGEKFFTSWEVGEHAMITAYVKEWARRKRLRIEKQEYTRKSLVEALEEKLNGVPLSSSQMNEKC